MRCVGIKAEPSVVGRFRERYGFEDFVSYLRVDHSTVGLDNKLAEQAEGPFEVLEQGEPPTPAHRRQGSDRPLLPERRKGVRAGVGGASRM